MQTVKCFILLRALTFQVHLWHEEEKNRILTEQYRFIDKVQNSDEPKDLTISNWTQKETLDLRVQSVNTIHKKCCRKN